jgi:hypothetical protein
MTHRTDRVYLPIDEPRCTALHGCMARFQCGRYMAPIGRAPLGDYSEPFACIYFIDVADCQRPPTNGTRRVHPPLGS